MTNYEDLAQKCMEKLKADIKKTDALKLVNANLRNGVPTYLDARKLSKAVGNICSNVLGGVNFDDVPLEELEEYADKVIGSVYGSGQKFVNDVCQQIQEELNLSAKIGIHAVKVPIDNSRINHIKERFKEAQEEGNKDKVKFLVGKDVADNLVGSVVTENIKANASLHSRAGLPNKIIRHLGKDGCCKWCQGMAGSYEYGDQPSDFWRIHKNCDCWFEYRVGLTKSAVNYKTHKDGSVEKITTDL